MRALFRLAAVAVAGAALYFAGIVNSIIIEHPERGGVGVVVMAIAVAIAILLAALVAADARPKPVQRHLDVAR